MIQQDANIATLELAAQALNPILEELILVGGCTVSLLITDKARPIVRATIDVDLLTEVSPLANYYELCEKLRSLGFVENPEVICRWTKGILIIDVMSTDEKILGFTNKWYGLAAKFATSSKLPNGVEIRHISAPFFIATKLESFYGRAGGDYLHHDMEDIINIVDGRIELLSEIKNAPEDLQKYLQSEFDDLIADSYFFEVLPQHLGPTAAEQGRLGLIIERFRVIAGL